jgi:phosphate-selective porin
MSWLTHFTAALSLTLTISSPVVAKDFLLGEETKGVTISAAEYTNLTVRILLQPRLDTLDLTRARDGNRYDSERDLFIRRAWLDLYGDLIKNLQYAVRLAADNVGRKLVDEETNVLNAYLDYTFFDAFSVRAGKAKLPYSRIGLSPSAKQLLIERPIFAAPGARVFDEYYQPNLLVHGNIWEGVFAYNLAIAQGWDDGETLRPGHTVRHAAPLYAGRVEFSPPGWIEGKQSDAHLGKGRHFTCGISYAVQNGIEFTESSFGEDRDLFGFDLSGHWKSLTAQLEYINWKEDFTEPGKEDVEPRGWYLHAGYFIKGINLEPVVRYEDFDFDSNASDKGAKSWTVGVNWYLKGHSLKISANWVRTKFEQQAPGRLASDDERDIFQFQVQFLF